MEDSEQLRDDLPFEEWVRHVFDHDDPDWHFKSDGPFWNEAENTALALEHQRRLFGAPEFLLDRYSPNQIGAGFQFLFSASCSSHAFAMLDSNLPILERVDCIYSIHTVYLRVFAQICHRRLSNGVRTLPADDTLADHICYMLWDVIPLYDRTKNPHSCSDPDIKDHWNEHLTLEAACLRTMARILTIDHIACKESAIHGLGHWAHGYPDEVNRILDEAVISRLVPDELLSYVGAARFGDIL